MPGFGQANSVISETSNVAVAPSGNSISSSGVSVILSALAPHLVTPRIRLARYGQHFDKAVPGAACNGAVQVVNAVLGHFIRDVFFFGLLLFQANMRHVKLNKGRPRLHRTGHLEFSEIAKQRVLDRIPSHVCCRVGNW